MALADAEITIRVDDGGTIFLRPTLRAASRLERRYGFPKLIEAISEANLTIIADVIRESSDGFTTIPDMLARIGARSYRHGVEALIEPLLTFVMALAGIDPDADEPNDKGGDRITFAEYHAGLFRIATGWLGWSPETAWNATAAEIIEAQTGRVEMLKAIFGSGERETKQTGPVEHTEAEVRHGIAALKALGARMGRR